MPPIQLTNSTRQEYLEASAALATALVQSPFAAKLRDLQLPAFTHLVVALERDEYLAECLLPARFTGLVRAARWALGSEGTADRLLALGFARIVGVLERALAGEKVVARLAALRFVPYVDLLEEAAGHPRFGEMLQLYRFPEWVEVLERAAVDESHFGLLQRLDFHRLRRLILVTLGLSRIAANREGLRPDTVLRRGDSVRARSSSAAERLVQNPYAFDFFWALRCLEAECSGQPRLGCSTRISDDFVRLRQEPEMRFASSTLRQFTPAQGNRASVLSVNFLGFFGPHGALPVAFTEYAIDRIRDRDYSLARFADVFHHRLLSLFYRSWAVHQKAADLDRPNGRRFAGYAASFAGLGQESLQRRDAVPDLAKLYFSGHLAAQTHHAEGLSAIVSEFFGIACEVASFQGHWIAIALDEVCRLGSAPERCSLGTTAIVGSRVYQYQTKFRLRLGPMRLPELQRLLPRSAAWPRLKAWVRNYLGDELLWDAQFILLAAEVPPLRLGAGALLGWTTWLTTKPPAKDAEDVIIDSSLY